MIFAIDKEALDEMMKQKHYKTDSMMRINSHTLTSLHAFKERLHKESGETLSHDNVIQYLVFCHLKYVERDRPIYYSRIVPIELHDDETYLRFRP